MYWASPSCAAHEKRSAPKFRTQKVTRGEIVWDVRTSGTIEPVLKVTIGTFVSGPIIEINADFNDVVKKGMLLAKVDPRIYQAAVSRDEAALAISRAEVMRVKANLQQAMNDERRATELNDVNADYISASEMDQFRFARQALEAQLDVAKESIKQAAARLADSAANLDYTRIIATTDGIVIDKKIDEGQTLAAQFQTPELFILAPEMDKRMLIHARVMEADVGHVIRAKKEDRPVQFYVDAYEGELFEGKINQVRRNPIADQTVVTYPVIVETSNPDMKLLPGMTANLSFEIERKEDVILVPGSAVRFLPDVKHIREEDKEILEGSSNEKEDDSDATLAQPSAADTVAANRKRRQRHVWVKEGDQLRAIKIEFGLTDGKNYELVKGDVTEGTELVTGVD